MPLETIAPLSNDALVGRMRADNNAMRRKTGMPGRRISVQWVLPYLAGLLPTLPVLLACIATIIHIITNMSSFVLPDELVDAFKNSVCLASLAASAGLIAALTLSSEPKLYRWTGALMLLIVLLPGGVVALGYSFLTGALSPLMPSSTLQGLVQGLMLLIGLTGYVLPYQTLICMFGQLSISTEERCAIHEYVNPKMRLIYFCFRILPTTLSAWLAGLFLAATEIPRSHYLATDLFGFGNQTLGSLVLGRMQTGGLSAIYFVMSAVMFIFAAASAGMFRSWSGWRLRLGFLLKPTTWKLHVAKLRGSCDSR